MKVEENDEDFQFIVEAIWKYHDAELNLYRQVNRPSYLIKVGKHE